MIYQIFLHNYTSDDCTEREITERQLAKHQNSIFICNYNYVFSSATKRIVSVKNIGLDKEYKNTL